MSTDGVGTTPSDDVGAMSAPGRHERPTRGRPKADAVGPEG